MNKAFLYPLLSVRSLCVGVLALLCISCGSSGPATKYFTLYSVQADAMSEAPALPSLGIGPVRLPGYLDNSALVSRSGGAQLLVSGYNAWAEPLDGAIARVLSENLAQRLALDEVWAFPWDTRNRPRWQLQPSFTQFDGRRGDKITLIMNWVLIDTQSQEALKRGKIRIEESLASDTYEDYVGAMNSALARSGENLARVLLSVER